MEGDVGLAQNIPYEKDVDECNDPLQYGGDVFMALVHGHTERDCERNFDEDKGQLDPE